MLISIETLNEYIMMGNGKWIDNPLDIQYYELDKEFVSRFIIAHKLVFNDLQDNKKIHLKLIRKMNSEL